MTTPYTTPDAVKTKLGISLDPDAVLDPYLESLIVQVSALFDTIVFGPVMTSGFLPATGRAEYHDGGSDTFILEHLFTEDGSARAQMLIEEDGVDLPIADRGWFVGQFPSNTVFRTSPAAAVGEVVFDQVWAPGHRNIKVIYAPAYTLLPEDVSRATDEETARAFKAGNSNSTDGGFIGITGRTPDAGTTLSYTVDDLTATTMRMLDGYRKRLSFY
jgi:hypothetical protein